MSNWKLKLSKYRRDAVRVMSEAAEVAVLARGTPGIIGTVAIGAKVIHAFNEVTHQKAGDYFRRGWEYHDFDFTRQLLNLAKLTGRMEEIETHYEKTSGTVWLGNVHGVKCGWIDHDNWCQGIWTHSNRQEARAAFGRLVWETMGRSVKLEASLAGDTLTVDSLTDALSSETANDLHAKFKKYNDAGYTRSGLIVGDPGVGKSHLMRYVSKLAGGYSLRIRCAALESLSGITRAIDLLRPSAVLIDDLDQLELPGKILSEIEEIKHSAKVFMCSVNDLTKLDPAVLRAGRFDEKVTLTKLDEGVFSTLIGDDVPKDIEKQLRELPIAWVDEFHICRKVEGNEAALAKVKEMAERHEEIVELMGKDEGEEDEKRRKRRKRKRS